MLGGAPKAIKSDNTDKPIASFTSDGVRIVALTEIGEATARIFGFHTSERLLERQVLGLVGRYPTAAAQRRIRGAA